ncbi:MAG: methyltransferase [Rhodospirillaceae bacterium]|nr:MAG: methyltransferase [Rhodospirillaceae bacterium]
MSSMTCLPSEADMPGWLWDYFGLAVPSEGDSWTQGGQSVLLHKGIPRARGLVSAAQAQTERSFGFKWGKCDTFERPEARDRMREWLVERYGDLETAPWLARTRRAAAAHRRRLRRAGLSGLEVLGPLIPRLRYLGIDISEAVDVARARFAERGLSQAAFMQADITRLPLPPGSVDVIFSEGALHHTDSTENTLKDTRASAEAGRPVPVLRLPAQRPDSRIHRRPSPRPPSGNGAGTGVEGAGVLDAPGHRAGGIGRGD